jgi:hypothetical protein
MIGAQSNTTAKRQISQLRFLVPYELTRDIIGADWRCGRNIFWQNGPA